MSKELLKQAADKIEELEKALAEKTAECVKLAEHIQSEKTAADKHQADAEKTQTDRVAVAKVAADKLLTKGAISTSENADKWTALVSQDHGQALKALSKLAELVNDSAPKVGTLVVSGEGQTKSANEVWDERLSKFLK